MRKHFFPAIQTLAQSIQKKGVLMEIKMAKDYGFCFGVKRAIQIAEKNQNSLIFGSLIHNAKEINRLEKNFNVKIEEDPKKSLKIRAWS